MDKNELNEKSFKMAKLAEAFGLVAIASGLSKEEILITVDAFRKCHEFAIEVPPRKDIEVAKLLDEYVKGRLRVAGGDLRGKVQ